MCMVIENTMERNMRIHNNSNIPSKRFQQQSGRFPQHDELIQYIQEAWHKITEPGPNGTPVPVYKSVPEPRLAGFQPFDYEAWWGRRVVQNIHISRGHQ